jgi:DNA invertase Pin-like site-specific DNA recombinase
LKQSSIKNRNTTAAIYLRLSRDDKLDGESYSISNQKKLLTKAAKEKGYTNLLYFADDGLSGTTMARPGFQKMVAEIEKGRISAVFVKDMSRLGRNYLAVGQLTDEFFPDNDIRLVAISDGVDSADGENEFTPFRNIMNEWYARDISKKIRVIKKLKGNAGEPLSQPPYGYTKDPENPKRWVIDEEAAEVVRKIFNLTLDGYGVEQVATILDKQGILTPRSYWQKKGVGRGGVKTGKPETYWGKSTIGKVLSLQEYCGDVINFKSYSKSYKNKTRIVNSVEDMAVFRDVHEPIIDRATYERIKEMRERKIRRKRANSGEKSMFSGLLVCADCGGRLGFHFNQKNPSIKYFNCTNNNLGRKTCGKTHYIRVDFLETVVFKEIRRLTKFANRHEDVFVKMVAGHSMKTLEVQRTRKEKELARLKMRDRELDTLFNKMYEDNVADKIDDVRFAKMSKNYTQEQAEISEKIKVLTAELETEVDKTMTADSFLKNVRQYTHAKKLSELMLNKLIDRIEVYHAERVDGVKMQKLVIHYNCIGSVEIPEICEIPGTDVILNTRKGVHVTYEPMKKVV